MNNKPANSILFISEKYYGDQITDLDREGFEVLSEKPDHTGCIPVRRVSDGEYNCFPIIALVKKVDTLPKLIIKFRLDTPYSAARIINQETKMVTNGRGNMFKPSTKPLAGLDILVFKDNEGQPSLVRYNID